MALRAATGRLLSQRLSRNFSAEAAYCRKTYEAKVEKLLNSEAEIINMGDPQVIKEFKELKNIVQQNEKLYEGPAANLRRVDWSNGILVAVLVGVAAYFFSLPPQKSEMEDEMLMGFAHRRADS